MFVLKDLINQIILTQYSISLGTAVTVPSRSVSVSVWFGCQFWWSGNLDQKQCELTFNCVKRRFCCYKPSKVTSRLTVDVLSWRYDPSARSMASVALNTQHTPIATSVAMDTNHSTTYSIAELTFTPSRQRRAKNICCVKGIIEVIPKPLNVESLHYLHYIPCIVI